MDRPTKSSAAAIDQAIAWQEQSRRIIFDLLSMTDLVDLERTGKLPLNATEQARRAADGFTRYDVELNSTPTRRIAAILTIPEGDGPHPAVLCCHGHGGSRQIVYDPTSIYNGFALELARRGFATISTDVGQHDVREAGRTLMGERLWDVMRCVTLLWQRPKVDASRIGAAGLSLGGEMVMWLGAMDPRVAVVVSSGYLTTMDNMEKGHCMCWKFAGLRETFGDWSDVYCLIAPRPLQCQNGRQEPPGSFCVALAEPAMAEIKKAYAVFGRADAAELAVHDGGHVFDVAAGAAFLDKHLRGRRT